jgi:hypothetical protein
MLKVKVWDETASIIFYVNNVYGRCGLQWWGTSLHIILNEKRVNIPIFLVMLPVPDIPDRKAYEL